MNKNALYFTLAAGAMAVALAWPADSGAQAGVNPEQAKAESELTAKLLNEIREQQTQLAQNQKAIDEKVAAIAEQVRLARAFTSRGK